ncbi:hypothetical protein QYE76_024494 [Lolium multiflorum]|uniref:Uncharacterized protein n=1 Tax=Lolium multiflorum TaxID=4521 RepID=A0AAD8VTC2_LOLMU|nr:hypothetical protein QYE76_024494 [Lolium multiflorum]
MVKKKGTAAASAATSATGSKTATAVPKRADPEVVAAIVRDAPGNWTASTMTKSDEQKTRSLGLISDKEEDIHLPVVSEVEEDPKDGDSTSNVESHVEVAEDSEASKEEDNSPFNHEAPSAEYHKILDDELTDTTESSQHDNDVDRVPFVDAAPGTFAAQPPKRPSGGFADEDELLFDSDEGYVEPPSKRAKTSSSHGRSSNFAKGSVSCFFFPKGKRNSFDSYLFRFGSWRERKYPKNVRLQQNAQSKSAQLDQAVKMAATARQETDMLKKELAELKKKLKEEDKEKAEAQIQAKEKEDNLRSSIKALLGAADIPANTVGKTLGDSAADAISLAVDSGEIV